MLGIAPDCDLSAMRIVYHHRTLLDGAEGTHITEMIRAFESLGHSVTVASPGGAGARSAGGGQLPAVLRRAMPGSLFELATAAHSVSERQLARRLLSKIKPGLVYKRHALNDVGMLRAARDLGIPTVLEVNVLYSSSAHEAFEPLRFRRLARRTERIALELATVVATVSTPLKVLALEIAPDARVVVVPNGVDPVRFSPRSSSPMRAQHGLPDDSVVVGWCGIMRPWHGLDLLLEAVSQTGMYLMLIGDGPERSRIECYARQLGISSRLRCTGRVPQASMPEHLAAIDIGVVADDRLRYASPMKLVEYMAMGKPVVAPDLPNIRDLVTDGHEGMLFDPGHAQSLAERLLRLQDERLRAQLGERGRASVETERNWIRNAERVLATMTYADAAAPRTAADRTTA
jgi:glycosyltransferase involved in cell wall biosynthesis